MYCIVLFLLVTCTLCVAQQQEAATLPVTFPARSIQGQQQGVCPGCGKVHVWVCYVCGLSNHPLMTGTYFLFMNEAYYCHS